MARTNTRGRNNNPTGRNQYSSDWMSAVKDRPMTAAAVIGRSLTVLIQLLLYWLRPVGLLLRPRLLVLAMSNLLLFRWENNALDRSAFRPSGRGRRGSDGRRA